MNKMEGKNTWTKNEKQMNLDETAYDRRKNSIREIMEKYISEIFSYWPIMKEYYSLLWWFHEYRVPFLSELLEKKKELSESDCDNLQRLSSVLDSYEIFTENLEKFKNDWIKLALLGFDEIKFQSALYEYIEKYKKWFDWLIPRIIEIFIKWKWTWDTWFLYADAWGRLYWKIEDEPEYSGIIEEWQKIIFMNNSDILWLLHDNTTLVDVWSCDWSKAAALLKWIKESITYRPIDINEEMLKQSKETVDLLESNIDTWQKKIKIHEWTINTWDLTDPVNEIIGDENNHYTYFFTWWSIWNYSDETIRKLLWKTFKPKKWNLIMDYYKAPRSLKGIRDILKCYDNKDTKNWFMNWLKNLKLANHYRESATNNRNVWDKNWNKMGIDDFFKYSVRYEFTDHNMKNYYAELYWDEIKIYEECDGRYQECNNFNEQNIYPWKIVEWFTVLEDTYYSHWISNPEWARNPHKVDEYLQSKQQLAFVIHWSDLFNSFKNAYFQYDDWNNHWLIPINEKESIQQYVSGHKDDYIKYRERDNNDENHYRYFPVNLYESINKCIFPIEHNISWGICLPIDGKKWEFIPIEISRRFSDEEIKKLLGEAGRNIENIFWTLWNQWLSTKFMDLVVASTK